MGIKVHEFNNVYEWDFERYHQLRETLTAEEALKVLIEENQNQSDND